MRGFTACLALLLPGCGEEFGPKRFATTTVRGQVLTVGTPVHGGWVEIFPVEGTPGDFRSVPLDREGRFQMHKVPVGRVALRLDQPPRGLPIPSAVTSFGSPIRFDMPQDPPGTLVVDVIAGRARFEGTDGLEPRLPAPKKPDPE